MPLKRIAVWWSGWKIVKRKRAINPMWRSTASKPDSYGGVKFYRTVKKTENNKKYLAILPRSNKIQKPMKLKNAEDRAARIQSVKSKSTGAGKGDRPRPITSKYWENYDQINWKKK